MSAATFSYDFTGHGTGPESGRSFWMSQNSLTRAFSLAPPPRAADLLDVFGAVYAADRRSKRCFKGVATGQRRICIQMPVREPEFWTSPELVTRLRELLSWVSEDVWNFEFVRRISVLEQDSRQGFLMDIPVESPVMVSLFSGGLDSLAGLAHRALNSPGGSRILVSGRTHGRLACQQDAQVRLIRSAWGRGSPVASGDVRHVTFPFGIDPDENVHEEKSQRTRALLFLAFGAVTALQAQADTLYVFENGVGALNLPLNGTQLGTDNYRGVHPRTLGMAEALFEFVLGESIHIENPYMFVTKAEMCRSLPGTGLADVARETVSCDGYPQRVPNQAQCGSCTSCLLRRQSLFCAGLTDYDPGGAYRHDIFKGLSNLSTKEAHGFGVMSEQVNRITGCLVSDRPWQKLIAAYPELARTLVALTARPGAAAKEDLVASFIGLFRTYAQEWKEFASEVAAAG